MLETIQKITRIGIPVMGHIGLTPQRQYSLGGYKIQGKTADKVSGFNCTVFYLILNSLFII